MATQKTYLITGANRGIGKGFTTLLLQRPSTTVIAAVRDPSHPTAQALPSLPTAPGSRLILVYIDSSDSATAQAAVQSLKQDHNITSLDVVIANAGIATGGTTVRQTPLENITSHIHINTLGPVALFQATASLLQASPTKQPIFVAISTLIGSLGSMEALSAFPAAHSPYGGSKAALNWFVRRLHFEEPWLVSWVFHPGLVETDMAAAVAEGTGMRLEDFGAISVERSVEGMVGVIDGAGREVGGRFLNYDGAVLAW